MKGERQDAAWIQGPDRSKAFTLIELLTVIVIIGLLVAMITPSLVKARTMARVARTQALLNTLGSGLEMFQADQALGEEYPPSYWDPKPPMPASIGSGKAYGAHTLVWGLAGADLMGTVGFTGDLAALYGPTSTAVRRGPFVDLSHMQVGYAPQGEIPDIESRNYRVILDSFGMPILYFRADPRQSDPNIYARNDNLCFFSASKHPLGKSTSVTARDGTPKMTRSNAFLLYTWDSRVAQATNYTKYAPYNRDKYLLISAGPDMQYGTEDDVTNFMLDTNKNLAKP